MTYQSIHPHDGKVLKSVEHISSARLDEALAAVEECFKTWKHKSCVERAAILKKAAALLHAHADDFAMLETMELGKRIAEARGEVTFSGDILACCAERTAACRHAPSRSRAASPVPAVYIATRTSYMDVLAFET